MRPSRENMPVVKPDDLLRWLRRGYRHHLHPGGHGRLVGLVRHAYDLHGDHATAHGKEKLRRDGEHPGESPEWTTYLGAILSQVAWAHDYRQEFERPGKVDWSWCPKGSQDHIVLIEHENDVERVHSQKRVKKLAKRAAEESGGRARPLAVVVSYPYPSGCGRKDLQSPSAILRVISKDLRKLPTPLRFRRDRFLLILGGAGWPPTWKNYWRGWVWTGRRLKSIRPRSPNSGRTRN